MGLLDTLGGLGNGIPQGIQNYQAIQAIADKIRVAHALSNMGAPGAPGGAGGLGGMGGPPMQPPPQQMGPQPQPMAPGQPSMPGNQPAGMTAPPQAPPPGVAPMASGGGPAVPMQPPPAITQQPPGQQQQPPPGGGQPDLSAAMDPMAPIRAYQQLLQEIKAKNPGIDPRTATMATDQIINSSKGLDPALRAGMQLVSQQMSQAGQNQRQTNLLADRDKLQGDKDQLQKDLLTQKNAAALEQIRLKGSESLNRLSTMEASINQRFNAGQMNQAQKTAGTEAIRGAGAQLTAATRQLTTLQNQKDINGNPTVAPDDPRIKKAQKDIDEASSKIDFVSQKLGLDQPAQVGGGASGAPMPASGGAPAAGGLTASDGKGNTLHWNGNAWVPVGK